MKIHVAHARPIGEDADVFFMAAGYTEIEAVERLNETIEEYIDEPVDVRDAPSWTLSMAESEL